MQKLDWFKTRVGRKIYRDPSGCSCGDCAHIVECGLIIHNKDHAQYLYEMQGNYAREGIKLNYRDKK